MTFQMLKRDFSAPMICTRLLGIPARRRRLPALEMSLAASTGPPGRKGLEPAPLQRCNFHLHDLPGFSEALNRFRERAHVFVFTKPFCQILSMNDLLAVQTGPFIQPLIQHIHSLDISSRASNGLQQVLLGRGKFQEAVGAQVSGPHLEARVVFRCHLPWCHE